MSWVSLLILLSLGQSAQPDAPPLRSVFNFLGDKQWEFRVNRSDVEGLPRWPANAEHPPLSPRAAIQSARGMMRKLFPDGDEWLFNAITLAPTAVDDAWIYTVLFASPPPAPNAVLTGPVKPGQIMSVAGSQSSTLFTLIVLMDGRALDPIVTQK